MLGLYIGVAASSLAIISVNSIGWRDTYRLIGIISLGVTFFTIFLKEPKRGIFNSEAKIKALQVLGRSNSKWERF